MLNLNFAFFLTALYLSLFFPHHIDCFALTFISPFSPLWFVILAAGFLKSALCYPSPWITLVAYGVIQMVAKRALHHFDTASFARHVVVGMCGIVCEQLGVYMWLLWEGMPVYTIVGCNPLGWCVTILALIAQFIINYRVPYRARTKIGSDPEHYPL